MSDNVASTARGYGDRFFLYRVYVGNGGEFRLIELQNPMVYDWPKTYRVDPFIGGRAKQWELRMAGEDSGKVMTEPTAGDSAASGVTS